MTCNRASKICYIGLICAVIIIKSLVTLYFVDITPSVTKYQIQRRSHRNPSVTVKLINDGLPESTTDNETISSTSPLMLQTIAKLTFRQLREESLKYNLSAFPVPKLIHQSWKISHLPPRFKKWSATWKKCFPDWNYRFWTDEDNDSFVKNVFPWFNKRYKSLFWSIHRADAVRYLYLFAFGGIYVDLDTECVRPFPHLLSKHPLVFGAMEGEWFKEGHIAKLKEGYVQNSFMYSVPGHPFWLKVIETIMNKRKRVIFAAVLTGPFMLQEVIGLWRQQMDKTKVNMYEIKIYDPKYFNPFSWIKPQFSVCKDMNKMNSVEIKRCKAHFPEAYVMQYHAQSWGKGSFQIHRSD